MAAIPVEGSTLAAEVATETGANHQPTITSIAIAAMVKAGARSRRCKAARDWANAVMFPLRRWRKRHSLRSASIGGMRAARKHVSWYSHGLYGSAEFRSAVNRSADADAVEVLIHRFYDPLIEREQPGALAA